MSEKKRWQRVAGPFETKREAYEAFKSLKRNRPEEDFTIKRGQPGPGGRLWYVASEERYQENPSREANVVIGGGLGVLLGGILLGLPGALVGGGIGAVLGSESGDTRRRAFENPQRTPSVMGCDTEAQTLIFDRRVFNTVGEAQKWARTNGFKSTKVDTNINTYRLRQKLPSAFLRGSFRTVTFRSGVQAVIGCPRVSRRRNG